MTNRRNFLRLSALSSFTATIIPQLVRASNPHLTTSASAQTNLHQGPVILFQGDSITDAGRNRGDRQPNSGPAVGNGYVHHIVTHLLGKYPEQGFQCYNRGISADKVFQLSDRWDSDCLQLKPDVLSILIGINDFWHTLDLSYQGTAEKYENDYRQLLERTRQALPEVRLLLGEPFAVSGGSAINERWQPFPAYRQAARRIADEFGAVFIPYHSIYQEALKLAPAAYWCPDGVHPSLAGAWLMKEAWLAGFAQLGK